MCLWWDALKNWSDTNKNTKKNVDDKEREVETQLEENLLCSSQTKTCEYFMKIKKYTH